MMKKAWKITWITLLSLLGVVVLTVGSYAIYVLASYSRIEDNLPLEVSKGAEEEKKVEVGETYSITTYNIGFGAYSQDYTFFLDEGIELDGTKTVGHYSTCRSKEEMLANVQGARDAIVDIAPDFAFFQEVDLSADRSYHHNQYETLRNAFSNYDATFALNFHSSFLAYPLYDMHGASKAGIATFSRFPLSEAVRKQFCVSTSFSKFFDLDRCFSVQQTPLSDGRNLHLINVHMSAYDEGGVIRQAQREQLNQYLKDCLTSGDEIIVGGDFNHDLLTHNPSTPYTKDNIPFASMIGQQKPNWLQYFFEEDGTVDLADGMSVIASDNAPTCRDADVVWKEGHTYVSTIDGFLVSRGVEVISVETQVTKSEENVEHFAYSDHDPVCMKFRIK